MFAPPVQVAPPPTGPAGLVPHRQLPFSQLSPGAHMMPQPPQLSTSLRVSISQPFVGLESQSRKPMAQLATVQAPDVQLQLAFIPLQLVVQLPQWSTSLRMSVSQPVTGLESQSAKPGEQLATAQAPDAQLQLAFIPLQAIMQPPQWLTLLRVLISQPFAGFMSQLAKGRLQPVTVQEPETQSHIAFCPLQTVVHVPQWASSTKRFTSQPLDATPSQLPNPG